MKMVKCQVLKSNRSITHSMTSFSTSFTSSCQTLRVLWSTKKSSRNYKNATNLKSMISLLLKSKIIKSCRTSKNVKGRSLILCRMSRSLNSGFWKWNKDRSCSGRKRSSKSFRKRCTSQCRRSSSTERPKTSSRTTTALQSSSREDVLPGYSSTFHETTRQTFIFSLYMHDSSQYALSTSRKLAKTSSSNCKRNSQSSKQIS